MSRMKRRRVLQIFHVIFSHTFSRISLQRCSIRNVTAHVILYRNGIPIFLSLNKYDIIKKE